MSQFKYIAEFRYKPEPEVLDMRGKLASVMLSSELEKWTITTNRIDVTNKKKTKGTFIDHTHAGFAIEGDHGIEELMRSVGEGIKAVPRLKYGRIGFRLTLVADSKISFAELRKKIEKKLMNNEPLGKPPIKSKIEDVALSYVFKLEDDTKININLGPMEKEQANEYFNDGDPLPKVGIFLDIDCFINAKPSTDLKEVQKFVHFAKQKVDSFRDYFLKVVED